MQRVKNTVVQCLGAIFLIALSTHAHAVVAEQRLVILIWNEYLDASLVARFEREYNAKVAQVNFGSDEERTAKLLDSNAAGYDLILTSGIDLRSYVKRDWLARINAPKIANLKHIDAELRTAFPNAKNYAIPYFWGTLGIVYRHDLLTTPITTWKQLFDPAPELRGKICMVEDGRDLISMGLKTLGYSANSSDKTHIEAVEFLLLKQKPFVKSYLDLPKNPHSPLLTGDITVAMVYNGDALFLRQYSDKLTYVLPAEGGNIWIDYLAIGAKSHNPDLAYQFLNFINEPENAAQLAQYVAYASPNTAAAQHLPAEFIDDPLIYPAEQQLQNSEYYAPLPPRAQRRRNQIMTRVLR